MEDEEIKHLVLQYMRKKGYAESEMAFKRESSMRQVPEEATKEAGMAYQVDYDTHVVNGMTLIGLHGMTADASKYVRDFTTFAHWVDRSLDMYRSELSLLLYPLFVHCYLVLVGRGASAQAATLMKQHSPRFSAATGASPDRIQEIQDLQMVVMPQHLTTSSLAKAALRMRVRARLSKHTFNLLMHHLQASSLWSLLDLLNQRMLLEALEAPPQRVVVDNILLGGRAQTAAAAKKEALLLNQTPLEVGLLVDCLEDRWAEAEERRLEAELSSLEKSKDEGSKKVTKKAVEAMKKQVREARARTAELAERRMQPVFPLPPPAEEQQEQQLQDRRLAVPVDGARGSLPSCCMFTFVNTRQGLQSVAVDSAAAEIAGGFRDGSIRVYPLAGPEPQGSGDAALTNGEELGSLVPSSVGELAAAAAAEVIGTSLAGNGAAQVDAGSQEAGGAAAMRRAARGGLEAAAMTLRGHRKSVYALDYSMDGRFLVSASGDGTLRLWSREIGTAMCLYRAHQLPVWDVRCCPYGFWFASGGADRVARLWCTESLKAARIFAGHQADVDVVDWHPSVHLLATGSGDLTVRVWDVRTAAPARIFLGHSAAVTALRASPDGLCIASADADGSLRMWDLRQGKQLAACPQAHKGPVWSLAWNLYGASRTLVSGSADCSISTWSLPAPAPVPAEEGAAADGGKPLPELEGRCSWSTKATPVLLLQYSPRQALVAAGPLTLPTRGKKRKSAAAQGGK